MKVIADTCVWSKALRKKAGDEEMIDRFRSLVSDDRVVLVGPIRQEILSGIRDETVFNRIAKQLDPFPDLPLTKFEYVLAARFANRCRANGIQGSLIDFLLVAAAINHGCSIFTVDADFEQYSICDSRVEALLNVLHRKYSRLLTPFSPLPPVENNQSQLLHFL